MSSAPYEPPPYGFRTFLVVWLTQSVSVIGSNLTLFAITIWFTLALYPDPSQQRELALAISALSLAFAVPSIVAAPIAGVFADRHDRKTIMIGTDLLNGLLSLLLAALLFTRALRLGPLLAIAVVSATAGAFHAAAFDASYVMLVPRKQLPRANGLMQTTWSLAGVLAPVIAAALISLPALARSGRIGGALGEALAHLADGAPLAIFLDALTFLLAGATLLFLTVPSPKHAVPAGGEAESAAAGAAAAQRPRPDSIWAGIREGLLFLWYRRPLFWLLCVFAVINLILSPMGVVIPLLVKFHLAADWTARGFSYQTALALINSAFALGGVAGGLFISVWGGLKKRRVLGVLVPLVPAGLAGAVVGLSPSFYLAAAMLFLMATAIPLVNAHSQAIWQTQTPAELQGRVFSVRHLIARFTNPIGVALAGSLVALLGAAAVAASTCALMALFSAAQLFNSHLMKVEDKDYLDGLAAAAAAASAAKAERPAPDPEGRAAAGE